MQTLHRHLIAALKAGNSGLALVLAVGRGARRLAPSVVPQGLPIILMKSFTETGSRADWQNALDQLSNSTYAKDIAAPTFALPTGRGQIPSADLPYGTPRWVGTSGTRGSRPIDRTTGKPSADYLKIYLPSWVNELPAPPLSAEDAATVALLT